MQLLSLKNRRRRGMRGDSIVGALGTAARWLVTARYSLRIAVSFVLAALVATGAGAVPVEYDYVGMNFVGGTGPYSTSNRVTGYVILDNQLPASQGTSPSFLGYQFTDGIYTISNASAKAHIDG